jgi:hypothetical protein
MAAATFEEFQQICEQPPEAVADLFIPIKGENGWRFTKEAVETPVMHVAGTFDVPAAKAKAKAAKKQLELALPVFLSPPRKPLADNEIRLDSHDPFARFVAFVRERHAIYLRKAAGEPQPWTADVILRDGRFCNVYREHDAGTLFATNTIVKPHADNPDLWFFVLAYRCCSNEPKAFAKLLLYLLAADFDGFRAEAEAMIARGEKVYRTDSYKPLMPPRELKGITQPKFHVEYLLKPVSREREKYRPRAGEKMAEYSLRLQEIDRLGEFYAGQIIADLEQVEPLSLAEDFWTFAEMGLGSARGLNRVLGQPVEQKWSRARWLGELLKLSEEAAPYFDAAGMPRIHARNAQNCCCEFDKWERIRERGGKLIHRYKAAEQPQAEPPPRAKKARKAKPAAAAAAAEAGSAVPTEPAAISESEAIPAHILDDMPIAPEAARADPHCLQAALDYAARGWSVFPVPPGTKRSHWKAKPGEARWGATKDADRIRRAYAQWPNANVGLPTDAANGFWVLDADTVEGHGKDGIGALAALVVEHGPLPDTLRAESPSGSQHWYFRHPKDGPVRQQTGWREGIDIKGEGGMVLAPPSRKGTEAYRWVSEVEIAEAPEWLLRLVQATGTGCTEGTDIPDWIDGAGPSRKNCRRSPSLRPRSRQSPTDQRQIGTNGSPSAWRSRLAAAAKPGSRSSTRGPRNGPATMLTKRGRHGKDSSRTAPASISSKRWHGRRTRIGAQRSNRLRSSRAPSPRMPRAPSKPNSTNGTPASCYAGLCRRPGSGSPRGSSAEASCQAA